MAIDWNKAFRLVNKASEDTAREALGHMCADIIDQTPVLSGRLKAHWAANLNSPDFGAATDKTDPSGASSISAMYRVIDNYKIKDVFYFGNPQPYTQRISEGWSNQRPDGWIDNITNNLQSYLDKAARNNKV